MTERRDIGARLENWARWCTAAGPRGADCMTGAICETLRRAKEGPAPGSYSALCSVDANDALLIGRSMVKITFDQRRLLGLHYIDGERSGYIAALLRFDRRDFDRRMAEAQDALSIAASRMLEKSNSQ